MGARAHFESIVKELEDNRKEIRELKRVMKQLTNEMADVNDQMEGVPVVLDSQTTKETWTVDKELD